MTTTNNQNDRKQRLIAAGAWLRNERQTRGWSGSELARQLDLGQVRVSGYERGQYEVPAEVATQIAKLFDIPLLEARKNLGLWVPDDMDIEELHLHTDPAMLTDEALVTELANRIETRSTKEMLDVYTRRSDIPAALWDRLITSARDQISLTGYTNYFFWTQRSHFTDTLKAKAQSGVAIRILLGDPDSELTQRREHIEGVPLALKNRIATTLHELEDLKSVPGIDVAFSTRNAEAHALRSVFQFDDEAIVCENIAQDMGHEWLSFHIKRYLDGGPFDRYMEHIDYLWSGSTPWNSKEPG